MSFARLKAELEARHALKDWEIEENLDRAFFRPLAALVVAVLAPLRVTANQVSVAGMLIGMAAGPLVFGPGLPRALLAVALLWIAETLDAVDGQLARLTARPSRFGPIIDGLCSTLMLLVIYAFIGVGLWQRTGQPLWLVVAYLAALSHSLQASLYDFYRQEYARLARRREVADPDSSREPAGDRRPATWGRRVLLALFRHYARRQVWCTPTYQPLLRAVARLGEVPEEFSRTYARLQRPMVRWWNYLGSNAHLVVLSAALLVGRPVWYLWAVLVAFNVWAIALTWRQGRIVRRLVATLPAQAGEPALAAAGAPRGVTTVGSER